MRRVREPQEKHHRKPKSKNGTLASHNVSLVPGHKHRAWHILFYNLDPHEIAKVINDLWLDPDYVFVVVRRQATPAIALVPERQPVRQQERQTRRRAVTTY